MKNQIDTNETAINSNGVFGNMMSDEQINKCQKGLASISSFINDEKRTLEQEFYKDKSPKGKPISEWRKIQAEFESLWQSKKEKLYKTLFA